VAAQGGLSGRDLLAKMMSPPCFPITPEGLRGTWTFNALQPGRIDLGGFGVTAVEVAHKGGRTYGCRGPFRLACLPPRSCPGAGLQRRGARHDPRVDVLLHAAQFLESERSTADLFGHATVDEAIRLATEAKVGTLVLFHHAPARTDAQLDALACELAAPMPVVLAAEGRASTFRAD